MLIFPASVLKFSAKYHFSSLREEIRDPLLWWLALTLVNQAMISSGLAGSHNYYISSFVALVGVVANRRSRRAAFIIAALSLVPYLAQYGTNFGGADMFTTPVHFALVGFASMFAIAALVTHCNEENIDKRFLGSSDNLPFVGTHPDGKPNFWSVERSEDWCADCEVGAGYARIILALVLANKPKPPMSWIIRDMIRAGQWSGVECGFIQTLSRKGAIAIYAGHCDG